MILATYVFRRYLKTESRGIAIRVTVSFDMHFKIYLSKSRE